MTAARFDAREIPVEWVAREYQQVCGPSCRVENRVKVLSALLDQDEEGLLYAVEDSWWPALVSYFAPVQQMQPVETTVPDRSKEYVDCAAQPLALGCDAPLVMLTMLLVILIGVKVSMRSLHHRAEQHIDQHSS